jgi:plastocyanin
MEETTSKPMNKNLLIAGIVALILIGGVVAFIASQNQQPEATTATQQVEVDQQATPTESATDQTQGMEASASPSSAMEKEGAMEKGATKTFAVSGNNFAFDVKEMRVKQGDTVKVTFTNTSGTHDFVLDDFNVATAKLAAGASETVTFVANKKGSFEYYCSVGNHRAMGMKGTLIVE